MTTWPESELSIDTADGWSIGAILRAPDDGAVPGVVMVPGSRHERDAYTTTAAALEQEGVASMRIDVRGRGSSLGGLAYARMAPLQRRQVRVDVGAAVQHLATAGPVDGERLGLLAEQDTTAEAVEAVATDGRVRAIVLMSPRQPHRITAALARRAVSVFGMVSTEDRAGLRATVDAFTGGHEATSRLEVFQGLGFGVTMMSVRQFEHPDAEPLETMIARWLAERLV